MYKVRIFGDFMDPRMAAAEGKTVEKAMEKIIEEKSLPYQMTHCPASQTIYYNGKPVGCYYVM